MLIGVYGTLKKEFRNHFILEGSVFRGYDKVKGQLYDSNSDYPILTEGGKLIDVELYDVNDITFEIINRLETRVGYDPVVKETVSGKNIIVFTMTKEQVVGLDTISHWSINDLTK